MDIIRSAAEMQERALSLRREGRRISFVPTMGFLHEGHLSLMRIARERGDVLVASLFVNPTQFGPGEDFERYPRDFDRDEGLCRAEGVDILFYPRAAEMYAADDSTEVREHQVTDGLEGAWRPGHFTGVLTVVAKLFLLIQPDTAVFGQKDGQQLAAVRRMVRDLKFPVEIVAGPTVREPDGLAMSSRNAYLGDDERARALCVSRALTRARDLAAEGADVEALRAAMRDILQNTAGVDIQYAEVVDGETFCPVESLVEGARAAIAVKLGRTRLIDNMEVSGA